MAPWFKCFLYKCEDWNLDPQKPMESLGEFGGRPVIPASEGGEDRSSRASWLARVAIPASSGFEGETLFPVNEVEKQLRTISDTKIGPPYARTYVYPHTCKTPKTRI